MNKYEIVEKMKKNDRGFFALSDDEKEMLELAEKTRMIVLRQNMLWNRKSYLTNFREGNVYRIHESYQLPHEMPEGYRIATDEERNDFAYPTDCEVRYNDLILGRDFLKSLSDNGWRMTGIEKYVFLIPIDYIFDEQITDESLQNIDTPFGELPQKVQVALKLKGRVNCEVLTKGSWQGLKDAGGYLYAEFTYRLAKKKEPRYVEFDIITQNGVYMVSFGAAEEEDRPRKHYNFVRLSKIVDHVGFAGVQFGAQRSSGWAMKITGFINKHGSVTLQSVDQTNSVPATPIKARFLIGAK